MLLTLKQASGPDSVRWVGPIRRAGSLLQSSRVVGKGPPRGGGALNITVKYRRSLCSRLAKDENRFLISVEAGSVDRGGQVVSLSAMLLGNSGAQGGPGGLDYCIMYLLPRSATRVQSSTNIITKPKSYLIFLPSLVTGCMHYVDCVLGNTSLIQST